MEKLGQGGMNLGIYVFSLHNFLWKPFPHSLLLDKFPTVCLPLVSKIGLKWLRQNILILLQITYVRDFAQELRKYINEQQF